MQVIFLFCMLLSFIFIFQIHTDCNNCNIIRWIYCYSFSYLLTACINIWRVCARCMPCFITCPWHWSLINSRIKPFDMCVACVPSYESKYLWFDLSYYYFNFVWKTKQNKRWKAFMQRCKVKEFNVRILHQSVNYNLLYADAHL